MRRVLSGQAKRAYHSWRGRASVKQLLIDLRGRPTTGRNACFKQGVVAAGVLASGQEAVNVTNDGDGSALAGFIDKKSGRTAHSVCSVYFAGNAPTNLTA